MNPKARELGLYGKDLVIVYKARLNLHYFMPLPGTPWENEKPETIEDSIKNEMLTLMRNGQARGDFFDQMNFKNKLFNIS